MQEYLNKIYEGNNDSFAKAKYAEDAEAKLQMLLGNDTAGSHVYRRLLRYVAPLVSTERAAKWLTVGDGRYGLDGYHLQKMGAQHVQITDIAPVLLEESVARGIIPRFQLVNAEAMDLPDESVDFILCKEALHHFPRPYLGLYEMLRVARAGVVLVEPHDVLGSWPLLRWLENLSDRVQHWTGFRISSYRNRFSYEPVGNFVYKFSVRDIERLAAGLNLPCVAVRNHNYFWKEGLHKVPYSRRWRSSIYWKVALKKALADIGLWLGLLPGGLQTTIIFKKAPSPALRKLLRVKGYRCYPIPSNPYIKSETSS